MFWALLALMSLLAIGFGARPLLKGGRRLLAGMTIVFVAGASAGLYTLTGSPGVPSGAGRQPDVGTLVSSLAARLEQQPDDLNGWKMLGRSHMALGNFAGAVEAYERAVEIESAGNAQTLVDYGLALAQANGQQLTPQAISAFENAIALEPAHPEGLFYSGIGASNRGDNALAAERWEALLATDPPPEVRTLLEQRIAVWRGRPATIQRAAGQPRAQQAAGQPPAQQAESAAVVEVAVSVSETATAALPAEATVFLIARDPARPAPPIAVTRRRLSELPAVIELGDRESMIPGRSLSGFSEFELVARVSLAGTPAARPGDWFGSLLVSPASGTRVALSIDEQVQ